MSDVSGFPGSIAPAGSDPNRLGIPDESGNPFGRQAGDAISGSLSPTGRFDIGLPDETDAYRTTLPNPQDFIDRRLKDYDALEKERVTREISQMNASLAARGLYSAGGAAEMERRILEESGRRRDAFTTDLMIEAERQGQSNARDEFGLNLSARGQELGYGLQRFGAAQGAGENVFGRALSAYQAGEGTSGRKFSEGLQRFGAGETAATRQFTENLDRFLASRQVGREERANILDRFRAGLAAQEQQFQQGVTGALTKEQLAQGEQGRRLTELRANLDAEAQNFNQSLVAFREDKATRQQVEDSVLKFWSVKNAYEQQDFENNMKSLELQNLITRAQAEDIRAAFTTAADFRRSEQDVLLKLVALADLDDQRKIDGLNQLLHTSGNLLNGALDMQLRAALGTQAGQGTNAEINAATSAARARQQESVFSGLSDVFGGLGF